MADGDRPGGRDADGGPGARMRPSLRLHRGARARGGRASPPDDVADRLTVLERQVEAALAGGASREPRRLQALVDQALVVLESSARRAERSLTGLVAGREPGALLAETLLAGLYRYWWRVDTVGLEHVPTRGRVLIVANRAGGLLPYEALMVAVALASRHPAGRRPHTLVDDWVTRLPLVGQALAEIGVERGGPAAMRAQLGRDEAVIFLPEPPRDRGLAGLRGRSRLGSFGRATFARVAIETGAPIVPVAVIGAEEAQPVLARVPGIFGLPSLPLTPTFPWLGLAGLVPLPTKWTLHVGEPIDVAGAHRPVAARDPGAVRRVRDHVRERLQALVLEGRRRRASVLFG